MKRRDFIKKLALSAMAASVAQYGVDIPEHRWVSSMELIKPDICQEILDLMAEENLRQNNQLN